MTTFGEVGKALPRIDAVEKTTGAAMFTSDMKLPGMLHARVLRSPYAHARIVSIDASEAERAPGVRAVATFKNTSQTLYNGSCGEANPPAVPVEDERVFNPELRFVGDEVAAVAAETEEAAEAALALIKVEYEKLPAVFDPLEALKPDAPAVHPCPIANNVAGMMRLPMGDVQKGFAESDVVVEQRYFLPVVKQCQMETAAAVADYSPSGKLTVWSTTQSPHPAKSLLARVFGLPASKVRVANPPYVGGAFGAHVGMSAKAELIAAALSILAGRPVRFVYSRQEDFTTTTTRHSGYITVRLGAKKDGTFQALSLKVVLNTGAYADAGPDVAAVLGVTNATIYKIPNVFYDGVCVYTNITPAGAMRGFGNPQGNFAVESTVDIMASKLHMDPLELQMKNLMTPYAPWLAPYPCVTCGLGECLEKGAARIGWERRATLNRSSDHKRLRGIGVSAGTHVSNSWPFAVEYDNAYLAIQEDGSANLAVGVPELGQGISTTLCQLAASTLGVPMETVSIVHGDTMSTPYDIGSHASRTLYSAGKATVAAAQDARRKVLAFAAERLKVEEGALSLEGGVISVGGEPRMEFSEAAYLIHRANRQIIGVGQTEPFNAPPWHAHFAEVEVDMETGQIRVLKVVAAHDVGRAVNPDIVEGQIQGSILQGIGYALSEQMVYDANGKAAQDGFHKYYLPSIQETPEIEVVLVETNEPSGPYGAKGVGECGLVPTAAAIANAVFNATGIRFDRIPITEERMLLAIEEARAEGRL